MNTTRPLTPFFWSAALHTGVAALIIAGFFLLKPSPDLDLPPRGDDVFQTVPVSPVSPATPSTSARPASVVSPVVPVASPAAPSVRFVPPAVVAPRPAPVIDDTPPAPATPRTTPPPATTRPQARPSVTPVAPAVSSRPAPAGGPARTPPRINVDEILAAPSAANSSPSGRPGSDAGVDDAPYVARFLAALRAAHTSPEGVGEGLVARVSFRLTAAGGAEDVRVETSSGDAAFDRSVVAAFGAVRVPGAPAASVDTRLKVTFRATAVR